MTEVLTRVPDAQTELLDSSQARTDGELSAKPGLPETFGPFVLTKKLGSGGVSEVYRAYYTDDPMQSPIAVKRLLRPSERGIVGLLEEARIAARLDSNYIVKVLEQTRVSNRPVLVMEFVDGPDLATLIRRVRYRNQAFPTEVILSILIELGRAVQIAHNARDPETGKSEPVVHFDLKPSNILLGRDGSVKLTDFGIAKQQDVQDFSQEEGMVGTLAYMAPERVRLDRKLPIDQRVDVFSVGAIAYELCTLETLFNGSQTRMIQQLLNAESFVSQALEKIPDYVHPELKGMIAHLLKADPDNRYADVGILLNDLETLRDNLRLPVDLAHFVGPYMAMDVLEEGEERVTAYLPIRRGDEDAVLERASGPITHLSAAQLTELLRRPVETVADPGILARQRERKRRVLLMAIVVLAVVIFSLNLAIRMSLPVRVNISADPENALVSVQPGCEGAVERLQPAPFVLHSGGPWPVCLKFEASGYVSQVQQVYKPSLMRGGTNVNVKMTKEVCVEVDSKPKGLPIYIANIRRGVSGSTPVRVCGFEPGVPYYVQLEYRGERWDIQAVEGVAGQTVMAFHDFGGKITARATPMQRCRRYFRSKNYQRAVEICRVAVTQAVDHRERVEALVIEGRAFIDGGDQVKGCEVLHSALGTAVVNRDLELEREVQDWRQRSECGPAVQLTGQSLKAAERREKRRRAVEAKTGEAPAEEQAEDPAEAAARAADAAKEAAQDGGDGGGGAPEEGGEVVK